mmetsp:Transcript_11521/g.23771  ORF Transcript_11521/g.23771 Transcript_11521/m.23771 type:complete len:360 (+) Transcript_11521:52-1131(+)
MAVRCSRTMLMTAVSSLVLALSLSMTCAFVTPVERMTVRSSIDQLRKESPTLRLDMSSKKIKTLIGSDEQFLDDDDATNLDETKDPMAVSLAAATSTLLGMAVLSEVANAISVPTIQMPKELTQSFDPSTFVPVCAASDGLYRGLQGTAQAVVGRENFVEYGPLIASGLLRVRLELCVVESFFNEAVGPFIAQNGLSWVLPLHETVETFLAGTVFAIATTFILVGSTKILTVIITYVDFFIGGPLRLFGGFFFDRARGKPVILDVGFGPFKTRVIGPKDAEGNDEKSNFDYAVNFGEISPQNLPVVFISGGSKLVGQTIKLSREVLDAIDLFVGKSLVLWVTAYVGIKFIHFKILPDFP